MNSEILLDKKDEREKLLNNDCNIEKLEMVKKIFTLGYTKYLTTNMVTEYFETEYDTIQSVIKNNKKELVENGLKLFKQSEILEVLSEQIDSINKQKGKVVVTLKDNGEEIPIPSRGMYLINKRVLLNIAMLLRDSLVAKEVRRRLLDIIYDSEHGKGDVNKIVGEIDDEVKLSMDLGVAIVNGDMAKVIEINTMINELKNKRIRELEDTNVKLEETLTEIVQTNISYDSIRREIVANLMNISKQCYNSNFKRAYGEFYSFLFENGYRLESRRKRMIKKLMNKSDDLDIEKMELETKLDELKCINDKESKKIVRDIKNEIKSISKELKQTLRDFNYYEKCSKLSLIRDIEFEDVLKVTRSWSLAKGYMWKEGLVNKEDIDLPF